MTVVIEHSVWVDIAPATSEPVTRAGCRCGWSFRCSLGWQHAMDQAREHATLATHQPPSGRINLPPMPTRTLSSKEDS